MAHRILRKYPRSILKTSGKEVIQKYKYLLVMDFEATCEEGKIIEPQEIIEFPCMALSTQDWKVKSVFHEYVKPRHHPTLTSFCTKLTGIIQETIDNEEHFPIVFDKFCTWLNDGKYVKDYGESAFVTCGDWDLKIMLRDQCNLESLKVPRYMDDWIDLKKSYCEYTRYFPRSLTDMLVRMNIPLKGRLHSGINDVENMISIIRNLALKHNAVFKINSSVTSNLNSMLKERDF